MSGPAPPGTIGVAGAGTMGIGIAQLASMCARDGVVLVDPAAEARERAEATIRRGLAKLTERGRIDDAGATRAIQHLRLEDSVDALAPCDLVIEAIPEQLDLKRDVLARIAAAAGPDCVLATNTSSLSVTAIAAGVPFPSRVVGMHFFNPPPLMPLVEVVAGLDTDRGAIASARATAEAMGKRVVVAADTPGFVVNRCNRPFTLEALRLVEEGIATPEQVDRICRLGGGWRMGPFELMDLVGIDVGVAVSESFYEQSYGEPRWRPSTLAARMAARGHLGRKTGQGWYRYPPDRGSYRPADPPAMAPDGGEGRIDVLGETPLAGEIAAAAHAVGWEVAREENRGAAPSSLVIDCAPSVSSRDDHGPRALLCDGGTLAALDPSGAAMGFFALPPFEASSLVELTRTPSTPEPVAQTVERFFASLGRRVELVGDAPGLVLGRIVAQLVNEARFALAESVASEEDVDGAMVLALNYPRGPVAWGRTIGARNVLRILEGLLGEYHDPRYRPAPALTRAARAESRGGESSRC